MRASCDVHRFVPSDGLAVSVRGMKGPPDVSLNTSSAAAEYPQQSATGVSDCAVCSRCGCQVSPIERCPIGHACDPRPHSNMAARHIARLGGSQTLRSRPARNCPVAGQTSRMLTQDVSQHEFVVAVRGVTCRMSIQRQGVLLRAARWAPLTGLVGDPKEILWPPLK